MVERTERRSSRFLRERSPVGQEQMNAAEYFIISRANRENWKATLDLVYDDDERL